ncbi:MAG: peptidoglycan DL-endopeptidase CwlO [Gemmatimonadaceae bacterium]|nr:peptidoglycan DL-endopeptidase CwlO [Gemmatimonadaceae bacterium]
MNLRRSIGLSGVLSYLVVPVGLAAQVAGGVEFFGSLANSAPVTRTLGGLSLSVGTPYLGIRGSGGLGISSPTPQATFGPSSSNLVWATDADLVLGPVNAGLGEGFMPYTFGGIGMESSAQPFGFTDAIRTWSYGGGLQLALGRLLSVNGEARSRHLAAPAYPADSQFVRGIEYRVGIAFHFGGGRQRSSVYSRRRGSDSPPAASAPSRRGGVYWPTSTTSGSGAARRVVPAAERYIGVPYRYGGSSPESGFDCSGFVQYVYGQQGVDLPRTSRQMAGAGVAVDPSGRSLAVGDLLLFSQGGRISHVAIYAGNGRFIHSSSSGKGVRYDDLDTSRGRWFAEHMVAARRVTGDSRILGNAFAAGSPIAFDRFDPPDSAPPPSK